MKIKKVQSFLDLNGLFKKIKKKDQAFIYKKAWSLNNLKLC